MKIRQLAFVISIIGGILLIVSGTQGPIGIFLIILEKINLLTQDQLILNVAGAVGLFLVILSSLGGFTVILGGYMINKSHKGTGKMLIGLGAGVGIPWLLFIIFTIAVTQEVTTVIAQHSIEGWTGIILSFIARSLAR
jgi:hypothetical protein